MGVFEELTKPRTLPAFVNRILGYLLLAFLLLVVYVQTDEKGWIRHEQPTPVMWLDGSNWITGEYREYSMIKAENGGLYCSAANRPLPVRMMRVRYWGRVARDDKKKFAWNCLRQSDAITCWAIN